MSKVKLCCFTVNYTHACIISNNFISSELSNVKTIYINEKMEKGKIKKIVDEFYIKNNKDVIYKEYLDENFVNDYEKEEFVFVIIGRSKFIKKINNYLKFNDFDGYIINCYDIFDNLININNVILSHDYYLNTSGIVKKEKFRVI